MLLFDIEQRIWIIDVDELMLICSSFILIFSTFSMYYSSILMTCDGFWQPEGWGFLESGCSWVIIFNTCSWHISCLWSHRCKTSWVTRSLGLDSHSNQILILRAWSSSSCIRVCKEGVLVVINNRPLLAVWLIQICMTLVGCRLVCSRNEKRSCGEQLRIIGSCCCLLLMWCLSNSRLSGGRVLFFLHDQNFSTTKLTELNFLTTMLG